jgi:hypothetical protein
MVSIGIVEREPAPQVGKSDRSFAPMNQRVLASSLGMRRAIACMNQGRCSMGNSKHVEILKKAWDALGRGAFDDLAAMYTENMSFVLPGQNDVLHGKAAFRQALDSIGEALPPGFDIKALRYCVGENEVVNIVEWTSTKIPEGTQSAILFGFDGDLIREERWFVDTEQWKAAF